MCNISSITLWIDVLAKRKASFSIYCFSHNDPRELVPSCIHRNFACSLRNPGQLAAAVYSYSTSETALNSIAMIPCILVLVFFDKTCSPLSRSHSDLAPPQNKSQAALHLRRSQSLAPSKHGNSKNRSRKNSRRPHGNAKDDERQSRRGSAESLVDSAQLDTLSSDLVNLLTSCGEFINCFRFHSSVFHWTDTLIVLNSRFTT